MSLSFILELLGALPQFLRLIQSIADRVAAAQARGQGRAEAIAAALTAAARDLDAAAKADREAAAAHAAHPADDGGFDQDFQRKD